MVLSDFDSRLSLRDQNQSTQCELSEHTCISGPQTSKLVQQQKARRVIEILEHISQCHQDVIGMPGTESKEGVVGGHGHSYAHVFFTRTSLTTAPEVMFSPGSWFIVDLPLPLSVVDHVS